MNCPIGAAHAGVTIAPTADAVQAMSHICPRCDQPAQRLINDRNCVSCYNRELEVRRGRNAKGGRPILTDVLRPAELVVREGASHRTIRFDLVKSTAEAIVIVSKRAQGTMTFGPVPPRIPGHLQAELCL